VEVISSPHSKRITQIYGHCGNESVGFLIYLKNKYDIFDNPKIINYKHTAGNKWAIVNTSNINNHSNKIILLNHPGDEFKVSLSKISDELYELKDLDFLSNKFLNIINLEISNENLVNTNIKMLLEIYTIDNNNTKKTMRILDINDLKTSLQISVNEFDKGNKLFFKIKDLGKKNDSFDFSFLLKLKNKYNLKDYKIIEKNSNCYYIK